METIKKLILASGSPRRADLLHRLGIPFEMIPPRIDETPLPGEAPKACVQRLAVEKALSVTQKSHTCVLGADTLVVLGKRILGKPVDATEAKRFLRDLSGKTHTVITGFCLARIPDKIIAKGVCQSLVTFKTLTDDTIEKYVGTGEPMDKAGAYGVQGEGKKLIEKIGGSESNVIGLPVEELIPWFKKLGFL